MDIAPDALDLMTRTLLGEADQTPEGWQALANVIKNRVNSRAWGANTKVGPVINAHKQFSVWNPDRPANANRVRAIPTSDGNYQRAAIVLQQVFNDQLPDNTGGATHFYAPRRMPNGQAPDWALGEQGRMIGSQIFYRLPLTAKNTDNTILPTASPSSGGPESVGAGNGFTYGGESPQDQGVDLRHLEPVFRARIDKLMADAAAAGIKTHLTDGYRDNKSQAADYAKQGALGLAAMPGSSYHQFGRAVDLMADNPAQQQALIALADQPGRGITAGAHFATPDRVHFQAVEGKTAPLLETSAAAPVPKPLGQGGIGSDARAPLGTAPAGTPPAVSTIVPNPNVAAADAQPVSATAPAVPGSDKYSVIQGMTTGTSHNPELITAANWGNLFGGATTAPPAPPAAAPAAAVAPAAQPATAPAPTPTPTPVRNAWNDRPSGVADPVRDAWNDRPSGQPGPPIAAAQVAAPPPPPAPPPAPALAPPPAPAPPLAPAAPPVAAPAPPPAAHPWDRPITAPPAPVAPPDAPRPPAAAHPWDLPMSLNQPAQIPGSMLPAAQRLIAMLFGTGTT